MGARDELVFDEAKHAYYMAGVRVPGVTSILAPLTNFVGIPPQVLAAKAQLGADVHTATEFDDDGDLDESTVSPEVMPYVLAYRKFRADTGAVVIANERRVYEPMFRYAGTLDRVLQIGNEKMLVDLKTCFSTPASAGPQTAAYLRALHDPTVTRRGALRLRPDGTYRLDALTNPDDWSVFLSCLTVLRYMEKHAS